MVSTPTDLAGVERFEQLFPDLLDARGCRDVYPLCAFQSWLRRNRRHRLFVHDCAIDVSHVVCFQIGWQDGLVTFDQAEFDLRCEWGARGLAELAPISDVVVIVDVLSFTTAIDIAASRHAVVFPYSSKGASAAEYARAMNADLAVQRSETGFSL